MNNTVTVRRIGNSVGMILGKETLAELGVEVGDVLYVVKTPEGVQLTAFDPDFAQAMEAGKDYMRRHRNALRELAR